MTLVNTGSESIQVEGLGCSCSGMAATPDRFVLSAGESKAVELTLQLDRGGGGEPKPLDLPLSVTYTTRGDPEFKIAASRLRGTIKSWVLTPSIWSFGKVSVVDGPVARRFEVVSLIPLGGIQMRVPSNPWGLRGVIFGSHKGGSSYEAKLTLSNLPPVGTRKFDIDLIPDPLAHPTTPPKRVVAVIEVIPDLRIEPTELAFGAVLPGTTAEAKVHVTSVARRPVSVDAFAAEGSGLSVVPGSTHDEYLVRLHVATAGAIRGNVRFVLRSQDQVGEVNLPVAAVGVGTD